jgi:hopene-associated glycosyltransferase HpnB
MMTLLILSTLSLVIWLYLALFHGRFWHADQRLADEISDRSEWPDVSVVIPARNEEKTIKRTVRSLIDQRYGGKLSIIVVNDNSEDNTEDEALSAALTPEEKQQLHVFSGQALEEGWVGKMWAVSQGIQLAEASKYILLTDADIEHGPNSVQKLVTKAETDALGLVSHMVRLECTSLWERLLIPAFVYFFQKLYPFPRVNDTDSGLAAAAGGCMLVRREDLDAAGGIARIKDKVIDDCSLAAIIKPIRPIWLGLTEQTKSIRPYDDLASIWGMVARSAYVQLRFNPLLLLGTIVSMMLVYLLPVVAVVVGISAQDGTLFMLGATTWLIMWWTFLPTLDLYNKSAFWAVLLPLSGFLFTLMTIDSARQHYLGRGGAWKGRTYTKSNIS